MAEIIVQRVVMPLEPRLAPLYYQSQNPDYFNQVDPRPMGRRAITLAAGTAVSFHSYFNCFFEPQWRRYTHLQGLRLRLLLSGCGTVRLLRQSADTGPSLLHTVEISGESQEISLDVPSPRVHHCEQGAIYFELLARGGPLTMHSGEWLADSAMASPVGLVASYCTYNRAPALLANVRALLEDADAAAQLLQIVVIDQGSARIREHPAFAALPTGPVAVSVVEQPNYGATGGFTRGILEASVLEGATHILLMDDDAVTEPESVLRTAAFLALARQELSVGGQMLDSVRPNILFDFSNRLAPECLGVAPVIGDLDVADPEDGLAPLLQPSPTFFNGWWFFAFPLSVLERVGLPLPFFIHFDDIEFGWRLARAGVPTIPVPGIGVWHEPFHLKTRSWTTFYDERNALVTFATYGDSTIPARFRFRKILFRKTITQLLKKLLSLDYFHAWALCEALRDYRTGPAALEADPRQTQRRVLAARQEFKFESVPRSGLLQNATQQPPTPSSRWGRKWKVARCLLRQLRRRPSDQRSPDVVCGPESERWWLLGQSDVVAIDDPSSENLLILRRSRGLFLRFLLRGFWEALRVWWSHKRLLRKWREAFRRLASRENWLRYLGLTPAVMEQGKHTPGYHTLYPADPRDTVSASIPTRLEPHARASGAESTPALAGSRSQD